ncbi:MAG: efflux RND transporter periplasmic adaptor subunit, partial [Gemmatimonadaceae bacterium]
MKNTTLALALLVCSLPMAACGRNEAEAAAIQTVPVERRDIVINAEATGVVEPINVVEVKSKASGQIVRMPVETGSQVEPGELLVQVDTRDVRNQYEQALADVRAAEANVTVADAQKRRSDDLFGQRIITAQEHEAAALSHAQAQASLVRARTNLDLAQQRLEDATVRAPVAGTVIEKTVSLGQVITSATGAFGGGTTLLKMADLDQVRVRAMVNETDIGNVQAGQQATVTVDAYPDRPFRGAVEKIEPQAVVQQSVTMFPVLISVSNRERLLMPGMNGEVSILVERRDNVLAVPNDAIRNPRDAAAAAAALGLDPDKVREQLQAQFSG